MPEEKRLLAEVREGQRLSTAAALALRYPVHSVVHGSDIHRKLLEADAAASVLYWNAKAALRLYRQAEKPRV